MAAPEDLRVTSHVGRDLLASAGHFKDPAAVVWEYVVNSLQYTEPDAPPRIYVRVYPRKKAIEIRDNGRGMDEDGLRHFFTMHGENPERAAGRMGRGKFGTGKSAAFGIANRLVVETRRNGKRNVVELTREMIEETEGEEIQLHWLRKKEPTSESPGTTILIDEIVVARLKTGPIIERIERHLQAWRGTGAEVAVNDHVCEYRKPAIDETYTFEPLPSQAEILGDVKLTIEVAQAPLHESLQGVVITAGEGNQVAIETAGVDTKPFGNYLFGHVDVPALETYDTPIQPYDAGRSYILNPEHPVVGALVSFLGSRLEQVRKKLVEREKEAQKSELNRRLSDEAEKIADLLNEDYEKVQELLREIRSASSTSGSTAAKFGDESSGGDSSDEWVEGETEPGVVEETGSGEDGRGSGGREAPDIAAHGKPDAEGENRLDPVGGQGRRKRPRGGFRVRYDHLGDEEHRSRYDPTTLTILINLDHPVVDAALGDGRVEDLTFRRLSYEIAFTEYVFALGYERAQQDPEMPSDDLLYDLRQDLNRISKAASGLYRA